MFFKPFLLAVTAMSGALAQTWTYKLASDATVNYVSDVNVTAKGQVNARFNDVISGCGTPTSPSGTCYNTGTNSDWASCCKGKLNNAFTQNNTDGAGASIQVMSIVIFPKCVASPPAGGGAFYSNGVKVGYQCPFLTCNPTYWEVSGNNSLNEYIMSQIDELTEGGDKSQSKIIGYAQSVTLMMKHVIQQYSLYEAWEASYECMGNYADQGSGDPTALDKAVAFWTGAYENQIGTADVPLPETSNKNLFEDSFTNFTFGDSQTKKDKADKLTGYYNDIQSGINAKQCNGRNPTGDDIGDPSEFAVLGNKMYRIQGIESETQVRTLIQDLSAVSLSGTPDELWWSSRRQAHDLLKIFEIKYGQCDKFASSIMLNYYDDTRPDVSSAIDPLPQKKADVTDDYFEWARQTILTRVMSNLRCLNVYETCENAIGTFTDSSGSYDCTQLGYPAKKEPDGADSLNFLTPIRNYTVDSKVTDHSYVEMDQQFCVNCMKDSKLGGSDKFRDMFASKAVYSWGQFSQKSTSARTMRNMAVSSKQNTFNPFFNQAAYQFYTENYFDPFGITQYDTTIANRFGDQLVQAAYGQDPTNPFYKLTDIDMQTRYEMASKAQQYNTLNYYILREGYDVIHDCEKNNNNNDQSAVGAKAVDEATVFATGWNLQDIFTGWDPSSDAFVAPTWAGITNGPTGNAYPGAVWCSLAEKYVPNEGDKDYNKPRFNATLKNACSGSGGDNFIKVQKKIQAIAQLDVTASVCQEIVPLLEQTGALIAIPYIQGFLRYSYLTDPHVTSAADDNSANAEYAAEQYAFWTALAPTFMQCNPDAATRIANSMRFQILREATSVSSSRRLDGHNTKGVVQDTCNLHPTLCDEQHIGAEELWGLVYSSLPCMGLTCDQVGDGAEDWFPNGGGTSYPYTGLITINLPTCSQINFNNPERPAALNSNAADGDYIFAQYVRTSSDVTEHSKISQDVRQIYSLAVAGQFALILRLYEDGASSIKSPGKFRNLKDMAEKNPSQAEWVLPTLQCAYDDKETWATQKLSDLVQVCNTNFPGSSADKRESCAEMLVQGYIFLVVAPYVGHEGDDCYQDCLGGNSTTNNAAVKACNEALAFYTGWDQPFDTVLDRQQSTYSQAEQIAQFFYDDPFFRSGRSGINGQSMDSFYLSEVALNGLDATPNSTTKTKICDSVHQAVRQFEGDITVTESRYLAWALLWHVGKVPSNLVSGAMKDYTYETVQTFESVLWPKIKMCNPVDAASFHSQLGGTKEVFDAITTEQQVNDLLEHIVNNCQCIGIDVCQTLGPALELLAGGADWGGDVSLSGQNITDIGKVGIPGTPNDGFDELLHVYKSLPDPKTCNLRCDQPSNPGDEVNFDTCTFLGTYTNDEQFSNKYVCHPPQPVSTTGFVYAYSYLTNQNNLLLADTDSLAIQNFVDSGERFFDDAMAVYMEGRSNFIKLCGTSTSDPSCADDATLPGGTHILAPSTYMTMQSIADASAQQPDVTFEWQTEDNNYFAQVDINGLVVGNQTSDDAYDIIITAALQNAALFSPPSNEWNWEVAARSQIAKKTVQASATPQALRYFQEAQNKVCANDVQTALLKWEKGAAMVFGSILGTTTDAIKGQFLAKFIAYRQSERTSITDKTVTFLNDKVQQGQTVLATNSSTACDTITTINEALNKRVGLAYYQGMQKYAEKCKDGSCSSKYAGEMMAFAFQAVPRLYGCDSGAANFVMANVNIFQPTIMTYGLNAVMGAYEKQFSCLGWTCAMVGDLNADFPCQPGTTAATNTNVQAFNTAYAAWEAANNPPSAGSSTSLSFVVATIAVMIAAAAF